MSTPKVSGYRNTRVCPICEASLGSAATRCLVCGAELPEVTITDDSVTVGSTSTTAPQYVQRTAQSDRANIRIPIPVAVAAVTFIISLAVTTRGAVSSSVVAFALIDFVLNKLNTSLPLVKVTVIVSALPESSDTSIDLNMAVVEVAQV